MFRTTWDYFDRFAEFSAWLDRVQSLTRLCNPPATVRWNLDKHYLADLAGELLGRLPEIRPWSGGAAPRSSQSAWLYAIRPLQKEERA